MIRNDVELAPRTTFRLGGPARSFATAHSTEALVATLKMAGQDRVYMLGSGSNILVHDSGVDGLVIANRINGVTFHEGDGSVRVTAGAGMNWDELVAQTVAKGLQGIECLSGIPGRVGAAPVQNIGAYGQSIADVLETVSVIDRDYLETATLTKEQCGFGYRTSIFQERPLLVTSVSLRLRAGGAPNVTYQDLRRRFGDTVPSLSAVRQAVLDIRASKGALAMDGYPRLRSAGSFFKNPVVSEDRFRTFEDVLTRDDDTRRWFWPQDDGMVKVAGGRLIEGAGFKRGYRDGSVGNSPYHSLSLVAYDGATTADVVTFARNIQKAVSERFGVILDAEPQCWGWERYPLLRSSDM